MRAAENKFIDRYNSEDVQKEIAKKNPAMAEAIPKIVRAEEFEKNKLIENNSERVQLTDVKNDLETVVTVVPKQENLNKTPSKEKIV